jgi:serine O-acetyltransferase
LISFLCPELNSLYIYTTVIGPGLFIQHGFATIISAKSIGKNCWINQQVTIGFSNTTDAPVILDNVTISAGAKVIGNVTIGSNSKIGAGTVVVKNVPENSTVIGGPSYMIKNGSKKKELLV